MKKNRVREVFLAELCKIPIVHIAAEKTGISRNSVYRWRNKDATFAKDMDAAMAEGEALINDLSESQLLSLIKDKNWQAVRYWLDTRNPKFRKHIDVTAKIEHHTELSPQEEDLLNIALERLSEYENKSHE